MGLRFDFYSYIRKILLQNIFTVTGIPNIYAKFNVTLCDGYQIRMKIKGDLEFEVINGIREIIFNYVIFSAFDSKYIVIFKYNEDKNIFIINVSFYILYLKHTNNITRII